MCQTHTLTEQHLGGLNTPMEHPMNAHRPPGRRFAVLLLVLLAACGSRTLVPPVATTVPRPALPVTMHTDGSQDDNWRVFSQCLALGGKTMIFPGDNVAADVVCQ